VERIRGHQGSEHECRIERVIHHDPAADRDATAADVYLERSVLRQRLEPVDQLDRVVEGALVEVLGHRSGAAAVEDAPTDEVLDPARRRRDRPAGEDREAREACARGRITR